MPQFLAILSIIIIVGSFFYYVYALTNGVMLFMLAVVLVFVILLVRRSSAVLNDFRLFYKGALCSYKGHLCKLAILFFVLTAAFAILFTHQTTAALRSPWESIPLSFFLLYGSTVLITIIPVRLLRSTRNDSTRGVTRGGGPPSSHSNEVMRSDGGVAWQDPDNKASRCYGASPKRSAPERLTWHLAPTILLTFLTLSISLIIFPLGSGFDPFIHQATEKIIAATGTITPKPLYYIGQYSLVIFLSKILGISVVWIDKLLVPILASLLLPWSIMNWWKDRERSGAVLSSGIADQSGHGSRQRRESDERQAVSRRAGAANEAREDAPERSLTAILFLLLPFLLTPFTVTTPYSLALLFLVVLIFHVTYNTKHVTNLLLAIATLLIHPLVGIPACIFLFISYLQKYKNKLLHVTCYMLCALAIPLAFLVSSQLSSQIHITLAPQNFLLWLQSIEWHGIYRENRFNAPLDLLYFYGFNIKNIFWFFVLTAFLTKIKRWRQSGVILSSGIADQSGHGSRQQRESDERQAVSRRAGAANEAREDAPEWRQKFYLTTFLILLTSYIVMSGFLSFNFLIGYEQADYAKRVLDIAQLFLIPFFLIGINWWFSHIPRAATILLLTLGITASLFLTYPQKVDSYAVSHAFNTSQADIDAVRWIDADAHGEDYIVLANQAVSAAAIRELGFRKYFQCQSVKVSKCQMPESVFFYPVPTGSPLYQYYLKMVYENASAETLREAMQLVGVKRSYFVLNRYWTDFEKIRAEASSQLTLIHSVNDSILIFTLK